MVYDLRSLRSVSIARKFFSGLQTLARAMSDDPRDHWDWALIRQRCTAEASRLVRGRSQDAEEVVQEALARGWRSRGSCRTPEQPLPWFVRITRNEAFRVMSQQRARPEMAPLEDEQLLDDRRARAEFDRMLLKLDVDRALNELSPYERFLIRLRYAQDCSHPEIASRLQIPEATARVKLHRAQKRLRSALDPS
jgi:RNA polymerase sigma-70 factor (ECF subfamily)